MKTALLQRSLLITGVALAGFAASAFGDAARLGANLPWLRGAPIWGALALCSILAVYAGAHGRWQRAPHLQHGAAPALLTLGIFLCGRLAPHISPLHLVLSLAIALPLSIVADVASRDGATASLYARVAQPLSMYAAALALFTGIHGVRAAAPLTMLAMGGAAACLAWLMYAGPGLGEVDRQRPATAAVVVALAMAQAAWPLVYWLQPALIAGLALLAVFYAVSGALQPYVHGGSGRSVAVEYALTGAVGLAAIVGAVLLVG